MKIFVSQCGCRVFTVGSNQLINICKVDVDGNEMYSIGIENLSFAVYKNEEKAAKVFSRLIEFLGGDNRNIFNFEKDS